MIQKLGSSRRRLAPWMAACGLMVGLTAETAAGQTQADQDKAVYAARFAALQGGMFTAYDPMETAAGVAVHHALPRAAKPSVSAVALDAAEAYARANRSTAFIVLRDGAVQRETYFGDVRADTPLVSKSLSKPLGAVLIGRAIAQGYIKSLDQPVSDFIPEWRDSPRSKILVRHLLDMRTGFLPQGPAPTADHILNRAYLDPHHEMVLINDYPLVSEPGVRFDYSNANGELVAIVIERATKTRFAAYLSQALLKPIGAPDVRVWLDRPGGVAHSGCCMLTPAETWLRLAMLLANDGVWSGHRLLPQGYVAEMGKGTPQNPSYGLGVYAGQPYLKRRGFNALDLPGPRVLHSEPYLAPDLFLFDGNGDQVVYIIPSERLVVLRLGDAPPAQPEWDNAFLPNAVLRGLTPASNPGKQP